MTSRGDRGTTEPVRVLFTFQYYPPVQLGGAEVGGKDLADALAREPALEVLRLCPSWGGSVGQGDGLRVFEYGGVERSVGAALRMLPRGIAAVRESIRSFKPSWVVANTLTAGLWTVIAVRTMRNRPRVAVIARDYGWWCPTHVCRITVGEVRPDCGMPRFARTCARETMERYASPRRGLSYWLGLMGRWAYARATAWAARHADVRFANSRDLAEAWARREGSAASVLGSGVPVASCDGDAGERPAREREELTAVFMGRGTPGKGAHVLAEAARELSKTERWRFIAYGSQGDADELGAVERRDPVGHPEAVRIMADADLVVVPSIYPEALPRTAIEAQAVGTPVVVTPSGGSPEAVAPSGGVVARGSGASDLASALREARQSLEEGVFDMRAARAWIEAEHGVAVVSGRLRRALVGAPTDGDGQ